MMWFDSRVLNNIRHRSVHWKGKGWHAMIAISRSQIKRDWWKEGDEEAKFFSWNWLKKSGKYTRTGIYIGRCAAVFQTAKEVAENA